MHGIVSLLDSAHYRLVEALWAELDEVCSVRGVYVTPFPHFSYHVAEQYEVDKLTEIVRQVARDTVSTTLPSSMIRAHGRKRAPAIPSPLPVSAEARDGRRARATP